MKFVAITSTIVAAFVLTACGKGDSPSSKGSPSLLPAGVFGTYKAADEKSTFTFTGGKVRITPKIGKVAEYSYFIEGNTVNWIYEVSGISESCEIQSSTKIYCTYSRQAFNKID